MYAETYVPLHHDLINIQVHLLCINFVNIYGTRLGAKGAVHAARAYLTQLHPRNLMLKLDFQNAFNSIRRNVILKEVLVKAPKVYPLAYSAYRFPSFLFYGNNTILSAEGVQQGDPLGSLLFCLGIHDLISSLQSQFIWMTGP